VQACMMHASFTGNICTLQKSEIDCTSEAGAKPDELEGNIEFKDVEFSYPARPGIQVINIKVFGSVTLIVIIGD